MATTIPNSDPDNYFIVANEPYNLFESGVLVFQVFRGQYFRWVSKYIPSSSCSTCESENGNYLIRGYAFCKDFVDGENNPVMYHIPDHIFEETYDTEDIQGNKNPRGDIMTCESWFHETGGYNKDLFAEPHEREEYKGWNDEKKINSN